MRRTGLALIEAYRDELNGRFARAGVPPEAMLGYLRRTVVPILDGWDGEPSLATLLGLFDLGVVGLRIGLVGHADPSDLERELVAAMRALQPHVERAGAMILRAVGNGYLQVQRECGAAAARSWLAGLAAGAGRCPDRSALFDLGVVLAWRAGLAEAREAALERAKRLDPKLVAEVLGSDAIDPDPARRFCHPGARGALAPLSVIATIGGFVGFGGPFIRPPLPRLVAGHLVCTDGASTVELFADVYGARLRPALWAHAEAATQPAPRAAIDAETGAVEVLGGRVTSAALRGVVGVAAAAGMVALTLRDSHHVIVLGRREATG